MQDFCFKIKEQPAQELKEEDPTHPSQVYPLCIEGTAIHQSWQQKQAVFMDAKLFEKNATHHIQSAHPYEKKGYFALF
jgi:hypothetical protein